MRAGMTLWKKFRHRLESAALRSAAWLIPRLSRSQCVRLANALGEIAYRLDRRGRTVALDNLRCCLREKTRAQHEEIARESYRNFARTILDLFWAPALARPENRHWLRVNNRSGPLPELGSGKPGGIYLTLHFGNWEWGNLAGGFEGHQYPAVAEKFKNPALEPIFKELREISGVTIIPQENSMMRMLKAVKRGGITAMLADLTLPPTQASTVIRAFGKELCVSVLHAVLAQRGGARMVPGIAWPDADGGCTVEVYPDLSFPENASLQQMVQQCWDFFEPHVRAHPGLWLWPYKHFRYKPKGATEEYPAYANESGAFEKLRRRELGKPLSAL